MLSIHPDRRGCLTSQVRQPPIFIIVRTSCLAKQLHYELIVSCITNDVVIYGVQKLSLYWQLDDSEPFVGVILIPDAIHIDGAGSLQYLIPLALRIGE